MDRFSVFSYRSYVACGIVFGSQKLVAALGATSHFLTKGEIDDHLKRVAGKVKNLSATVNNMHERVKLGE